MYIEGKGGLILQRAAVRLRSVCASCWFDSRACIRVVGSAELNAPSLDNEQMFLAVVVDRLHPHEVLRYSQKRSLLAPFRPFPFFLFFFFSFLLWRPPARAPVSASKLLARSSSRLTLPPTRSSSRRTLSPARPPLFSGLQRRVHCPLLPSQLAPEQRLFNSSCKVSSRFDTRLW